ncbi:hypothetical protein FNL37_0742 [Methylovorus glucosotrophus]|uniref:hypothetical protein n=1 Tax=Methylovorus glucosotrophus TaxID=266009 RepID=UPI0013312C27|nr:hypothetical protein [Methylovorus glucosotrophus]KAF0843320.1 hypothetical protein FNL37_0742 [Methylovorus glucosotrophus]
MKLFLVSTTTLSLLSSLALTGCASDPVAISKILQDKKAYFNQNFSKQSISESVLKQIPKEDYATLNKDTRFDFETKLTNGDKIVNKKQTMNYSSIGNGLFQLESEYSSNDITTGFNFLLNYRGLFNLKWVSASTSKGYSDMPYEIKSVDRWDKLGLNPGEESIINFKWGNVVQLVNYHDGQNKCTLSKLTKANELYPKLSGQIREFECQLIKDGAIFSRSKYAYIADWGVAIPLEIVYADYKIEYKLVDIH